MAEIPAELRYTQEHEYVKATSDADVVQIGITDFAQGELGDVVYVELPKVGATFGANDVFGTVEALRIGTSRNCELFAMSGRRDPYRGAKLGVIQENAWADVLLIDGDPTKDINVLKDFERNLLVIIKDGTIHKNMLA